MLSRREQFRCSRSRFMLSPKFRAPNPVLKLMESANSVCRSALLSAFAACLFAGAGFAQGTLADYQRAERFLPGNLRQLYTSGEITPHWLGHTSRFWYRHVRPASIDYVLVDPARNTVGPLFDNRRLAVALSHKPKFRFQ
jgi:hypothetical protein